MYTHDARHTTERTLRAWLATRSVSERETLARLWGLSVPADDPAALADSMLAPVAVARVLAALSERERAALDQVLAEENALIAAPVLERTYGTVRNHAHYPNPRAYLMALQHPAAPTERLYTLALLLSLHEAGRSSYYVPTDLRALLPAVPLRSLQLHLASTTPPPESAEAQPDELERNAVTLLALAQAGALAVTPAGSLTKASLLRLGKRWGYGPGDFQGMTHEKHWSYVYFLRAVLQGAGLLHANANHELRLTQAASAWVRLPQVERLRALLDGWIATTWDELDSFLGIAIKGYAFGRDLAATRHDIRAFVRQAPMDAWVSCQALADEVQRAQPDFVRRDGRYDTWRLMNHRRESLDGYEHWHDVEGALLRASIGSTLHWLGLLDVGGSINENDGLDIMSFRLTPMGAAVLAILPAPPAPAVEPLVVQGTFEVLVPPRVAPAVRFELDRYAQWQGGAEVERYKLTKTSVQSAVAAGASSEQIARFLADASGVAVPTNVAYTLREWSGQYGQITLQHGALLRAADAPLLEQIKRDRRVRMPRHETLAHDTILMADGDAAVLSEQLRRAGYGVANNLGDTGVLSLKEHDLPVLCAALEFYNAACAELGLEGEASAAMRQRVARLLHQQQHDRAVRIQTEALQALQKRLNE